MAKFALYSLRYEDQFTPNLFENDPDAGMQDHWDERQTLLGKLFRSDSSVTFQPVEGKTTYPHRVYRCEANPDIILMRFANVKDMVIEQDFEEKHVEHNPSCYVIIDNRKNCRRVAIQKLRTSFSSTDQVARIMEACINKALRTYSLSIILNAQRYPLDFYKLWKQESAKTESLRFNISSEIQRPTYDIDYDETETEYLIRMEEAGRKELDANCVVEYHSRTKGSPLRLNESSATVKRLVYASAGSGSTIELSTLDGKVFSCYIDTDLESEDKIVTQDMEPNWMETIFDVNRNPDITDEEHAKHVKAAELKVIEFVNNMKREVSNPDDKKELSA